MDLISFTDKSKRAIRKAFSLSHDCGFKYVEPQVLVAGIVNEGRDMISYVLQGVEVDKIEFCQKVNSAIDIIQTTSNSEPIIGERTSEILNLAKAISEQHNCDLVPIEYLFLASIFVPSPVKDVFEIFGITEDRLSSVIERYRNNEDLSSSNTANAVAPNYQYLSRFAHNLCVEAEQDHINDAIGRDEEIRRVIHIISRQTKNNPILVGEPGTGKTAIVEGLAHRIIRNDVPRELSNIKLYSLDVTSLIAGASHQGEFEERLKGLINEIVQSDENILIFIDEIHLLIGEGRSGGSMDAANILKPELARGKIKIIGATTLDEYKKYIESDKAFERRFQRVSVEEPDEQSALAILRGVRIRLEEFHKIRIKDAAIKAAVTLSARYIQDRFLPDKAIDLLDEAAAKMKLAKSSAPTELDLLRRKITLKEVERESLKREMPNSPVLDRLQEEISNLKEQENTLNAKWQSERTLLDEIQIRRNELTRLEDERTTAENQNNSAIIVDINERISVLNAELERLIENLNDTDGESLLKSEMDENDIMSIITEWTGIPITKLSEDDSQRLANMESILHQSVIGQDEAIVTVSNAIRRNRLGFSDPNKPIGSFLFLGTTGVGKTELCKALSEFLFDSKDALIRIDMSEYQQEHQVSKLFGAPPGYVGYEAGGQLTDAVRRRPYSVILFDEIEKAHPKVFETLLQVLDDGRMTDGQGRTVNFKNTIIVMTSNLGHQVIYGTLQGKRRFRRNPVGYAVAHHEDQEHPINETEITDEKIALAKRQILAELKTKVAPEFINRIDDIVMFLPLSKDDALEITKLQINSLLKKLEAQGFNVEISEDTIKLISEIITVR